MSTGSADRGSKQATGQHNPLRLVKEQTDCGESVYITEACARSIVYHLQQGRNIRQLNGELFDRPINTFSDKEKKQLLAMQEFFNDAEFFINSCYVKYEEGRQDQRLVFPETDRVYHTSKTCECLHSDYLNLEIPAQIGVQENPAEEARFCNWCIENRDLFERNLELFKLNLCTEFDILPQELNLIRRANSGTLKVINEDLDEIKRRIDELLALADDFYDSDESHRRVLNRYQKRTFILSKDEPFEKYPNRTGIPDEKVIEILSEYNETFKQPLRRLLITYYKVRYNPELKFSGKLLEQLGLRECRGCMHAENRAAV